MVNQLRMDGYIIQVDQPERVTRIRRDLPVRGFFTDTVSIPDLSPPRMGLYLVGFARGQIDLIGIGVHTGTPSTLSARIKIKKIIEIGKIKLADIFVDSDIAKLIKTDIESKNNVRVAANVINNILRIIAKKRSDRVDEINRLVDIVNGIDFDSDASKAELFAQQQDALHAAVMGLGVGWHGFEDQWEPDDYGDATTYLDGFHNEAVTAREDIILAHDQRFFGKFVNDDDINISTTSFTDGKTNILVTMANRTRIEQVFGVDLVYYNEIDDSYCMVQYKRMTKGSKGSGSYTYYPHHDGNYKKDMALMQKHTETFNQYDSAALGNQPNNRYSNYRLFASPLFFKFVYSIQFEPFKNKVTPGYYLSYDLWKSYVDECEVTGETVKACANTLKKHIGPNLFCDLLKRGMIGSRRCSVDAVVDTLGECLRNNRSAVFAYKPLVCMMPRARQQFNLPSDPKTTPIPS
jgi:hypothetical protein